MKVKNVNLDVGLPACTPFSQRISKFFKAFQFMNFHALDRFGVESYEVNTIPLSTNSTTSLSEHFSHRPVN